jgi:hypothetical protein
MLLHHSLCLRAPGSATERTATWPIARKSIGTHMPTNQGSPRLPGEPNSDLLPLVREECADLIKQTPKKVKQFSGFK